MGQRGSSLIYVILALAAVGGLGVVYLRENDSSVSKLKNQAMEQDADNLVAQLQRMLSHRPTCRNSFLNLTGAGAPVPEIKNSANAVVFDSTTINGRTALKIASMELLDNPGTSDGVAVVPSGIGSTHLVIKFRQVPNTAYEKRQLQRRVRLMVNQSANRIQDCWAVSSGVDSIWLPESGTENIYYSAGNVGVGPVPPTEKLDVVGNIRVENQSGDAFRLGGETEPGIDLGSAYPLQIVNAGGNLRDLQVGAAEGKETLQFSGAPSSCTGGLDGSIRYHRLSRTLQACSGGRWKTIQSNVLIMYP